MGCLPFCIGLLLLPAALQYLWPLLPTCPVALVDPATGDRPRAQLVTGEEGKIRAVWREPPKAQLRQLE